ncbi:MAG: hypothetical protein JWO38_3803 [Gemmataceae bacterium]|nr:hypothetical protein [Gemmataceae bacterium]
MRTRQLLVLAALVAPAGGCNWMKEWRERDQVRDRDRDRDRGGAMDPKDVTPEKLVAYLNDRASRLQSIQYEKSSMRISGKALPVPATLDGHLWCAQPRSFRLVGNGRVVGSKVIIGSNPEQFWLYMDVPNDGATYVYASHTDFDSGRARLPNDIPFEPDWVMQALGMTTFKPPPEVKYELTRPNPRDRDRTYTLGWEAMTPAKVPVIKEIVFDHNGGGARPVVKKHVIRDARSKQVIASAEVRAVETVEAGIDPRSPVAVQYPTHVTLRWEGQDFTMDLTLKGAQVNQMPADDQARRNLFARPEIPKTNPINLAEFRPTR